VEKAGAHPVDSPQWGLPDAHVTVKHLTPKSKDFQPVQSTGTALSALSHGRERERERDRERERKSFIWN
jgi:hypothetical protein